MTHNFFFIAILLILGACTPEKKEITISGQIDGYYNKPIGLYRAESIYMYWPMDKPMANTKTNEEGYFSFTFNSNESVFIHLMAENDFNLVETPILVSPKDSIFVKTSIFNTSKPEFDGANASYNLSLLEQRQNLNKTLRPSTLFELPIGEFVHFCNSLEREGNNRIDSLTSFHNFPLSGTKLMKADLLLIIATKRFEYLRSHLNQTQGVYEYLLPDDDFYQFRDQLLEKTSEYWFLPSYSITVETMVEDDYQHYIMSMGNARDNQNDFLSKKLDIIKQNYVGISQEVALVRLARRFSEYLAYPNPFIQFELVDNYMETIGRKRSLQQYFKNQLDGVSAIKPGNLAPNITLPNQAGELVSLEDMRGKVVLLIFWGTWCPPCLSSMPFYLEIQKRFIDRDVDFVFISLEARANDVEFWREFVAGNGLLAKRFLNGSSFPGIHLVAQGQFQNPQVQPYAINYAPSYVLIDRQGKIAYPRVSFDDTIMEKIEILIEK